MWDLRNANELLVDALVIIEELIASGVKPADGPVEICSDRAETVGFDHTLPELTEDKLCELLGDMATMINRKAYPVSVPVPKITAAAFCGVLKGDKVYLRLTLMYDIRFDSLIACFDCMTCGPLAVGVAA